MNDRVLAKDDFKIHVRVEVDIQDAKGHRATRTEYTIRHCPVCQSPPEEAALKSALDHTKAEILKKFGYTSV